MVPVGRHSDQGQARMTINLLEEFTAGRAKLLTGQAGQVHAGKGAVAGETRKYLFLHPPASLEFSLPGTDLRLFCGLAIHPDVWGQAELGACEFRLSLDGEPVFKLVVDPAGNPDHRRWLDVVVELPSAHSSSRSLVLSTHGIGGSNFCWALWSQPTLELLGARTDDSGTQPADEARHPLKHSARSRSLSFPLLFPAETKFLFVLGSMKSGTTWLMNLLDAHPDICCQGEMHSLEILDSTFPELSQAAAPPTLESVASSSGLLRQWYLMPNNAWSSPFREGLARADALRDLNLDFVRFFFERTIREYLHSRGQVTPLVIGDKSPTHTPFIMRKLRAFFGIYDPFVLHIVRDPRDVAVSRWFHLRRGQADGVFSFVRPFEDPTDLAPSEDLQSDPERLSAAGVNPSAYPTFLSDVLREWVEVNQSVAQEGPAERGQRYLLIRYEDLKSDLHGTLGGVFDLLGVASNDRLVEQIMEACDVTQSAQRPGVYRQGLVGDWKNHFNAGNLEEFERIALPLSRRFGYE